MSLLRNLLAITIVACGGFAYWHDETSASRSLVVPPHTQLQSPATQEVNDRFAKQYLERIAGQEKEPASKVFKNMQLPGLKDVPAANLINIMNLGYSRALGVTCTHCQLSRFPVRETAKESRAQRRSCTARLTSNWVRCKALRLHLRSD
jgi:hypothetical protein